MNSDFFGLLKNRTIALYGLGTETQRFLSDHGDELSIVGLLDGFRTDGTMYGYPIIPIEDTIEKNVGCIIVVARPGSCKAITKRIGDFCAQNDIELFDVRGKDLLAPSDVAYDFSGVEGYRISDLKQKIDASDVVSFDLFDTLVARKVCNYTDVFELVDMRLRNKGIVIPDLAQLRIMTEKELSRKGSPKLTDIYEAVLDKADHDKQCPGGMVSAEELSRIEWETDLAVMTPRRKVCEIFREAVEFGKDVVITSDCYYDKEQICFLLNKMGINGYKKVYVSSEYDTLKTQHLFDELKKDFPGKKLLHVGDDEIADIDSASEQGIDTFRIYGGMQLYDALGGLGVDDRLRTLPDRIKLGMFISRIFNNPFVFEDSDQRLCVNDSDDIGYLFCAPMITDFVHWMREKAATDNETHLLFCARDGYLIKRLYEMIDPDTHSYYFLTSRTVAIRAGVKDEKDIEYVDGMKYSGTVEEATMKRFGIDISQISGTRQEAILEKAAKQREHYRDYINALGINGADTVMFDFVAKGTTQMYLSRMFEGHMKGYYFLQLEPEFMAEKGLDIEPFYSDTEKDTSQIFDNYYILETILTAPFPQMLEFNDEGAPVYAKETRSENDLRCFVRAQAGIIQFFEDYISIVPEGVRSVNKPLDEALLALVNRVRILDDDFLSLKVEDPFFGRMTDIRDVLG